MHFNGLIFKTIGDFKKKQGKYKDAIKYYKESTKYYRKLKFNFFTAEVLNELGKSHLYCEDLKKARQCFQEAVELSKYSDINKPVQKSYLGLYEIELMKENFKKALEYYKESTEIEKTLINQEKINRIAQLESQNEIEKKNRKQKFWNKKIRNYLLPILNSMKKKQNSQIQ